MKQDFFEHLPPEIMINILSLLPVTSIKICKCVCKSWLALLESSEFLYSHLLKPTPALAFHCLDSGKFENFEFEDWRDLQHDTPQCKSVFKCRLPFYGLVLTSTNGLLFMCSSKSDFIIYICNPITRDYVELPTLQDQGLVNSNTKEAVVVVDALGFGVSKITGQYKVVLVLHDERALISESEFYVYTLGTGLWRRVAGRDVLLGYDCWVGTFLNGNLHWLVRDFEPRMFCFDLETEVHSTFSFPLKTCSGEVCVFEDYLCLCDSSSNYDRIDFWLMKEYGDGKSWTRQFSIPNVGTSIYYNKFVCPIKVFKGGDMLIAWREHMLFYCIKNNTVQKLQMFKDHDDMDMILFTPSFLSLKNFEMENATSF